MIDRSNGSKIVTVLKMSAFLSSSDTKLSFSSKGGIVRSDFSSKIRFDIFQKFLIFKLGSLRDSTTLD